MKTRAWLEYLDDEDVAFLRRFLLASGTLKELARQYGISYPTVRLRLDRLIDKVKLIEAHEQVGAFEMQLRMAFADGKLDAETLRRLLDAYRQEGGQE
ncbi:MAG: hypothetical protein A2135_02735 [Actinobacteria bacterium RBG_16_67_15]|jgi:hypothetical protein|nr:MAG: hypothetical protein A2135_02735 [Actinobacteria bacterium RBG_16_67_15]